MGTTFTLQYRLADAPGAPAEPDQIHRAIETLLEQLNGEMSTYLADSDLSRFNRASETNWISVPSRLAEVVNVAAEISRESNGAFDVTVAPLVNLWGFGHERKPWRVPSPSEIERLLRPVGFAKLSVRTEPPCLRKGIPELAADLSGIAKGYAVDELVSLLARNGVEDCLVEIGGEVRGRGCNPEGKPWRVGIRHPAEPDTLIRAVALANLALATSGDYAQHFVEAGRRYSHTIDPRTGWPVRHELASVSVADSSCARADAWATALNVLGPDEGFHLAIQRGMAVLMIVRTEHGCAEKMTPSFAALLETTP